MSTAKWQNIAGSKNFFRRHKLISALDSDVAAAAAGTKCVY